MSHPVGGVARVGVWAEPDPSAPTLGGAAVRSLVLPQLHVALPSGQWRPSLVVAGSEHLAADHRSVTFSLVPGAAWSDGTAIGAADLRRSADTRFVAGVDDLGHGRVTVRFTGPLGPHAWQRLWSGVDAVAAPVAGVWGGPFTVASYTPGLEVVLARNPLWYGRGVGGLGGPWLDELRLVLVPDAVTARQLLARGELDVVMPPASTNRTAQLRALPSVHVSTGAVDASSPAGGWSMVLRVNPSRITSSGARAALLATVDAGAFAGTLLSGEAVVPSSPSSAPAPSPPAASFAALADASPVDLVGEVEDPMSPLLQRAMQQRAVSSGPRFEPRNAEADRVEGWLRAGSYAAAVTMEYDGPSPCWGCRFGARYPDLAAAADAELPGAIDRLRARLAADAVGVSLWQPVPLVAWRDGFNGVVVDGYALSAAWNAWEWWRGAATRVTAHVGVAE